jgi:hypothetical protein
MLGACREAGIETDRRAGSASRRTTESRSCCRHREPLFRDHPLTIRDGGGCLQLARNDGGLGNAFRISVCRDLRRSGMLLRASQLRLRRGNCRFLLRPCHRMDRGICVRGLARIPETRRSRRASFVESSIDLGRSRSDQKPGRNRWLRMLGRARRRRGRRLCDVEVLGYGEMICRSGLNCPSFPSSGLGMPILEAPLRLRAPSGAWKTVGSQAGAWEPEKCGAEGQPT